MTNRDRLGRDSERQDWASQVPQHYGRRGPYEDYGWERGQSVLPEFRDPSVHEMPYEREPFPRDAGQRDARRSSPGSAMDAQRRSMMQNPYDYDTDYDRNRLGRGYNRGYDEDRWRAGGGSMGRGYDEDRWRAGVSSYGRGYDEGRWRSGSMGRGYDEDRWRAESQGGYRGSYGRDYGEDRGRMGGQGSYGGYARGYDYDRDRMGGQGSYDRSYDYDRGRMGGQGFSGGEYSRDYGSAGARYDYDRGRMGDQSSYGGYGSNPITWTYTEYWLIPGPFTGRGPSGYQRSDDRIKEDVCERLTQHGQLDASNIEIDVDNGEITLRGQVDSRQAKRMAEDAAESISGVREIRNELRVRQDQQGLSSQQSGQERSVGGTERRK